MKGVATFGCQAGKPPCEGNPNHLEHPCKHFDHSRIAYCSSAQRLTASRSRKQQPMAGPATKPLRLGWLSPLSSKAYDASSCNQAKQPQPSGTKSGEIPTPVVGFQYTNWPRDLGNYHTNNRHKISRAMTLQLLRLQNPDYSEILSPPLIR